MWCDQLLECLSWLPQHDELWSGIVSQINPSTPKLPFVGLFYHGTRKEAMMVTEKVIEDRCKVSCAGVMKGAIDSTTWFSTFTCTHVTPGHQNMWDTFPHCLPGDVVRSCSLWLSPTRLPSPLSIPSLTFWPMFHPQTIVNTNTQPLPYSR